MKDVLATYRFWQNSERNSKFINHMKIWYLYKGYSNCMIWFGKNYRNLINVVTFVCKFFPSESAWGFVMFAISTSIWYMQWISVFAFFFAQNRKKKPYTSNRANFIKYLRQCSVIFLVINIHRNYCEFSK